MNGQAWEVIKVLWGTGILSGFVILIWKAGQLARDVQSIKSNDIPHLQAQIGELQQALMGSKGPKGDTGAKGPRGAKGSRGRAR